MLGNWLGRVSFCNGRVVNVCSRFFWNCWWCLICCVRFVSDVMFIWLVRLMVMLYWGWLCCCMVLVR